MTLGVRPETMHVAGEGSSRITGIVGNLERLGGETYLYLNGAAGKNMTVHAPGDIAVAIGDEVAIGLDGDKCHLFDAAGQAFSRLPA